MTRAIPTNTWATVASPSRCLRANGWAGDVLAPILGGVGLTLVTVSHLIPIAMGYTTVPAYMDADPGRQAALAATADTFAAIALVSNAAGNFLGWGGVVPLYAVAILTTRALPRWIGWLRLLVGALAGWLGLRSLAGWGCSARRRR